MSSKHDYANCDQLSPNFDMAYKTIQCVSVKAINNSSACSVLFLSTTGLFPVHRKILEHKTELSALMLF